MVGYTLFFFFLLFFLDTQVARCWTYETAKLLNVEVSNDLPPTKFFEYYTAQQEKSGSECVS